MQEQDFSKRLVILVRKDLLGWEAANTVAHIAAYAGNRMGSSFDTGESFITKDGKEFPRNSQYPMIIKGADSSDELRETLEQVRESGYLHLAFIREMIETTNDAEIEAVLKEKPDSELELLGLGIFGLHEDMNALTKGYRLWR